MNVIFTWKDIILILDKMRDNDRLLKQLQDENAQLELTIDNQFLTQERTQERTQEQTGVSSLNTYYPEIDRKNTVNPS